MIRNFSMSDNTGMYQPVTKKKQPLDRETIQGQFKMVLLYGHAAEVYLVKKLMFSMKSQLITWYPSNESNSCP